MPSFANWSRPDIIAALALLVSCFAFTASAVSSFVSWRTYLASRVARKPTLRVHFEPFVDSEEWWAALFSLRNRSENVLSFERIRIVRPFTAVFSTWTGGYTAGGSGGGPMHNDLPGEVHTAPTTRVIRRFHDDQEESVFEVLPSNESEHLGDLIVRMPRWHLTRHVVFRIEMIEMGEFPKRVTFRAAAPFPTKENTKPRH
jgi:hypothetical protein